MTGRATSRPQHLVKGWCPGAHRPMMSGDGLIVRIRPKMGRLTHRQAMTICMLSQRYGSGFLDMTNRANLQIRGVKTGEHDALLQQLAANDLLDNDPAMEARRNILVQPFWSDGDATFRLARSLHQALADLPELPTKFGFAIDMGPVPLLRQDPADIRLERAGQHTLVYADGATHGVIVPEGDAIQSVLALAQWFVARATKDNRRMQQVVRSAALPADWQAPVPDVPPCQPAVGAHPMGALLGAAFGQLDAAALEGLLVANPQAAVRLTPWRCFLLEDAPVPVGPDFISDPDDPLLRVDACVGAPFCSTATVATRPLARRLAQTTAGAAGTSLHVSGCVKGCARSNPADTTLVGRDGLFDLVTAGCAWDDPIRTGLDPDNLPKRLD